jgi:hypothetical protein
MRISYRLYPPPPAAFADIVAPTSPGGTHVTLAELLPLLGPESSDDDILSLLYLAGWRGSPFVGKFERDAVRALVAEAKRRGIEVMRPREASDSFPGLDV